MKVPVPRDRGPDHRLAAMPKRRTCRRRRVSRLFGLAADVMPMVQNVIVWPMRARFGDLPRGCSQRIVSRSSRNRFHLDFGSLRERNTSWKYHDAARNSTDDAHVSFIPYAGLVNK